MAPSVNDSSPAMAMRATQARRSTGNRSPTSVTCPARTATEGLDVSTPGDSAPPSNQSLIAGRYLTSESIRNIGRYIAITITPTMQPTRIIINGSTIDVSDWIAASTSSS